MPYMTELFERSIQALELPAVLARLAEQAVTEEGKERCAALRPQTDRDDVERLLAETTAAADMMTLSGTPSFTGVKPVGASLQRAHMGGALNTRGSSGPPGTPKSTPTAGREARKRPASTTSSPL